MPDIAAPSAAAAAAAAAGGAPGAPGLLVQDGNGATGPPAALAALDSIVRAPVAVPGAEPGAGFQAPDQAATPGLPLDILEQSDGQQLPLLEESDSILGIFHDL